MNIIIEEIVSEFPVVITEEVVQIKISDATSYFDLIEVSDTSFEGKNGFVPVVNEATGKIVLQEQQSGPGGGIPEAPNNANAYVRSALSWVVGYTKTAIDNLLSAKVNNTRTINSKALSSDITLNADDIAETSTRFWLTNVLKTNYDSSVNWISTNGSNLLNHLTNTSNPHNTTASQVGAYTTVEVDNLITNVNTDATDKITVKLAESITKGQAVYVSSANGTNIIVSKASNATEATSSKTLGLIETTGVINDVVKVITEGFLHGLNTISATIGDAVWLGTSGNLIFGLTNKPIAPAHLVYIGVVTRVHATQGEILVKVQNGFELKEIHDVAINGIENGDVLKYNSANLLWENKKLTNPTLQEVTDEGNEIINNAGNLKIVLDKELNGMILYELVSGIWEDRGYYNTQGFTLGNFDGNTIFDLNIYTGALSIYQGTNVTQISPNFIQLTGATDNVSVESTGITSNGTLYPYPTGISSPLATEALIPTTATDLDALKRDGSNANSDVNIGENRIIAGKLVTKKNASASEMELNGTYLTTNHIAEWQDKDYTGVADITDIPDVSNLVVKNTAITGSTKTKITYDAKGLVTSGADATTADIADSTNKRYQTDNQNSFNDATSSIQTQLNGKQPLLSYTPFKFIQTSQTAHTGTTAETIVATATINGSTFNSSDVMKMLYGLNKGTTTSGASIRIKINTSNTLTGATQIAIFNVTGTASVTIFKRNFMLNGGNLHGLNFTNTTIVSDEVNNATTYNSTPYNTANTLYLFFTIQLITSGDSVTPNLFNLTN